MTESDLTPWYPGDVKPVRPGVYVRKLDDVRRRDWWNGEEWMIGISLIPSLWQKQRWRGLTKAAHDREKRNGS